MNLLPMLIVTGRSIRWVGVVAGLAAGVLFAPVASVRADSALVWRADRHRVDARIESWPLRQLLEKITAATGWQVFIEPETEHTISATFQNLEVGEALGRLLGDLNFALLPQTNAASKLFIFHTSLQEATQLISSPSKESASANSKNRISNELIVMLKPGGKGNIDELARQLGAKVVGRNEGLNAYRLQFEDEKAAEAARSLLESNPDVSSIENNYSIATPTRMEALSLSSSLPLNLRPNTAPDPHRLVIGLIDTPIQTQAGKIKDFVLPSLSVVGETATPANYPTHGTSMAETILRGIAMAPQSQEGVSVRILPVDVYGNNESTTTFDVANGIYSAIKSGATLINLSLGGNGDSTMMHQVIQEGRKQGVLFVASAGNEPSTAATYPAAYPEVLAATAGDKKGNIAPYANRGSFVAVVAPGTSIIDFNNQAYLVSGTSASAAYVTGLAAGLASSSGKTLSDVEAELRKTLSPKSGAKP